MQKRQFLRRSGNHRPGRVLVAALTLLATMVAGMVSLALVSATASGATLATPSPEPVVTTTLLRQVVVKLPHSECVILGASFTVTVPDGDCSVLLAQVAPADATGTVQFRDKGGDKGRDKTTALGDAPVQGRFGGLALLITKKLVKGEHELTAKFIPQDRTAFKPSKSNKVEVKVGDDD
ncbi:MAG: Ig-like domain repeat protein [Pseudonocardiaceae bacterium]